MRARLIAGLALLAVAIMGIIPQGWMPTKQGDRVLLVICTGEGVQQQWVDLSGDAPEHAPQDERLPCALGGLQADMAVTDTPQPDVVTFPRTARWHRAGFTHRSAGFHARYDARAPPVLS